MSSGKQKGVSLKNQSSEGDGVLDDAPVIVQQRKKPISLAAALGGDDDSDDDAGAGGDGGAGAGAAGAGGSATGASASAPVPAPAPAAGGGGKGKAAAAKGKGGKGKKDDEDWEALLDAAGGGAPEVMDEAAAAKAAKAKEKKAAKKAAAAAGGGGADGGDGGGAGAPAAPAPEPAPAPAAAPVKLTTAARLALERQAAARAAEERRARELEAERKEVEEHNRKLEEEARRKEELRAKRLEERRARKDAAVKAGTYRTKKQIDEAKRRLAALDKARAAGVVIPGYDEKRAEMLRDLAGGADADADGDDGPDGADGADAPDGAGGGGEDGEGGDGAPGEGAGAGAGAGAGDGAAGDAAAAAANAVKKKASEMYNSRKRKEVKGAAPDGAPAPAPAAAAAAGGEAEWDAEPAAADVADSWEDEAEEVLTTPAPAAAAAAAPGAAADGGAAPGAAADGGATPASASAPTPSSAPAPAPAPAPAARAGGGGARSLEERIDESRARRTARKEAALATRTEGRLRSPICVVLGHVDTGKTSLLDKIRRTNVQEGEAGGITQQIGATYFPMDRVRQSTDKVNRELNLEYRIPGLLVIDTPGHEQFTNLRSRGSSLCDIAVVVIDVMHGLERQTLESLQLLRQRKTPFVVALNKVDRMYGWIAAPNAPIQETLKQQPDYTVQEFETRTAKVLLQLAEQGLNAKLYYENDNFRKNVSVVPTSAHTGEGVPDLLMLIVQLTQQLMSHRLMFTPYVQATVLEVKAIDGLGTTVDVVLVNGELREGDTIVVCTLGGAVVTQVRALLTPPPLREMRVKSDYVHHKRIEAAMGVKIVASDLERAVAGTELLVLHAEDEVEDLKEEVMEDFETIMKGFKRDAVGVYVQASTLGSLEALLEYLRTRNPPVPVASVGIGPLHKKDVVQASVMLEHKKEYATILAFDVKITPEAAEFAERLGVVVFTADIIYHLTDAFDKHLKDAVVKKQQASLADAVFPVVCRILPTAIIRQKDPIILGVDVIEGKLKMGTPLAVVLAADKEVSAGGRGKDDAEGAAVKVRKGPNVLAVGRVAGIELNKTQQEEAVAGGPSVALKIEGASDEQRALLFGRHFDASHLLYAAVTRESIDLLKENFRDVMSKENWKTIIKLKDVLGVV